MIGVKIFPTISTSFVGLRDNKHVTVKNKIVNTVNAAGPASFDKNGLIPISNDTVPDLGWHKRDQSLDRERSQIQYQTPDVHD